MLWSSTSAAGGGGPLPRLVRIRQRFVRTGILTNRSGAVGRRLSRVVNGSSFFARSHQGRPGGRGGAMRSRCDKIVLSCATLRLEPLTTRDNLQPTAPLRFVCIPVLPTGRRSRRDATRPQDVKMLLATLRLVCFASARNHFCRLLAMPRASQ